MADIILNPLLQVVIDKLSSPFLEKLRDLHSLKNNIRKLQHSLPLLLAFLEDAEKRRATEKAVEVWLLDLKDATYKSEDLLDELAAKFMLREKGRSIVDRVRNFLLPPNQLPHIFDLAKELRNKLEELHELVEQGFKFNFKEGAACWCSEGLGRRKGTGHFVKESEIYGREKDKMNIVEFLLPNCKGKTVRDDSVIPIVGIGGLGKTTLARLVYNDEKVTQYFDLKLWVYVSEDFDVIKLMAAIIKSATGRNCEFSEMDLLQSKLQGTLCGKRFLLVLDDVWNEDKKEWDELGDLLKSGVKGSKIIVTTRSTEVASIMGTAKSTYHLKGLLEDDCWNLFKREVFGPGEEEKYPNLLAIGKNIITKCGGVPLAAKTLGCHLCSKREEKDWLFVQESELWNLKQCQSDILPVLRLSYIHLPLSIKRCFAFCSLFPKNCEIKKEKLIYIWMAEGLILPLQGNRALEDIADEYFNNLLCLCFFQEVEKCEDGSIATYKMHDLIHDLALSIGGNEFLILREGLALAPSNLTQTRHSSVVCNFDQSSFPEALFEAKRLRTLLFLHPGGKAEELLSFLPSSFIYLHVLDLSGSSIKRLPQLISLLICLRYLDLSNTPVQTLPDAICELYNLQTLNLSGCGNVVELPLEFASLTGLRHLITTGCEGLTHMPPGIGKLVHLQTLPTYIVGRGMGQSIAELNSLNLRGELNIKCLENVRGVKEAQKANLREKKHLHLLRLMWGNRDRGNNIKSAEGSTSQGANLGFLGSSHGYQWDAGVEEVEDILACLEPHPNLRKLFIDGYPGITCPDWVLPNLVQVSITNCRGCRNLPTLGKLLFLKSVCLQGMDGVTHISEDFYGSDTQVAFPSLKELTLRDLPNLEKWSSIGDRKAFPLLDKLIVAGCPKLKTAAFFPSLQHLELRNCHLQIINSVEDIITLSILVIDSFPELLNLPGELLGNKKCLTSLEISSCRNLSSLPSELGTLTALNSLVISECEALADFPLGLRRIKSLEFLEINGCHSMKILPPDEMAGLGSLRTLFIENCNNLSSLSSGLHFLTALERLSIMSCPILDFPPNGWQNLSTLRSLSIFSCPELASLPEGLQYVTTLQSLVIHSCPGLTALPDWVGNFSSLRSLAISNCYYLMSLPEGLRYLSELQHLSIQDCPFLEHLCKEKRGWNWRNIAHIPHIYIGSLKLGK